MADETLSAAALAQARTDAAVWTDEHAYALLPYSFCVLESLTIEQVGGVPGHDALSAASARLRTQLRALHLFTPAHARLICVLWCRVERWTLTTHMVVKGMPDCSWRRSRQPRRGQTSPKHVRWQQSCPLTSEQLPATWQQRQSSKAALR